MTDVFNATLTEGSTIVRDRIGEILPDSIIKVPWYKRPWQAQHKVTAGEITPLEIWDNRDEWQAQMETAAKVWDSIDSTKRAELEALARWQINNFLAYKLDSVPVTPVEAGRYVDVYLRLDNKYAFYYKILFTDTDLTAIEQTNTEFADRGEAIQAQTGLTEEEFDQAVQKGRVGGL